MRARITRTAPKRLVVKHHVCEPVFVLNVDADCKSGLAVTLAAELRSDHRDLLQ